jgi:hypothetical protein
MASKTTNRFSPELRNYNAITLVDERRCGRCARHRHPGIQLRAAALAHQRIF